MNKAVAFPIIAIAGHLHGDMPGDLTDQPFGDQAHLIDDTVQP